METNNATSPEDRGRAALVVAHPGHELRVFHWMELHQPIYFCLTDGSGGAGESRIKSTSRLVEGTGSKPGTIFGRHSDKELYRALLDGRFEVFTALARELAQALATAEVAWVVGDAVEGFNPVHDVCRFIIDSAVEMVRRHTGRTLWNYDFVLDSTPDTCPEPLRQEALQVRLDNAAVERKLAAASEYPELRDEVNAALARFGKQAFALEWLRPAATRWMLDGFESELPAYERYGKMRKAEGRYTEIILYRQHVLPLRDAIEKAARESSLFD